MCKLSCHVLPSSGLQAGSQQHPGRADSLRLPDGGTGPLPGRECRPGGSGVQREMQMRILEILTDSFCFSALGGYTVCPLRLHRVQEAELSTTRLTVLSLLPSQCDGSSGRTIQTRHSLNLSSSWFTIPLIQHCWIRNKKSYYLLKTSIGIEIGSVYTFFLGEV